MRFIKKDNPGFTLIEMLIVAVTASLVAAVMYATFNNGIKIWQKVNGAIPEAELGLAFDRFSMDLKNTVKFSGMKFAGEEQSLSFPALVISSALQRRTVGQVTYTYDESSGVLHRFQKDFSQVYTKEDIPPTHTLANVESLKFEYYFYDKQANEYLWLNEWSKEGFPLAVRMELVFNNGKEKSSFTKTVNIPLSS